MKQDSTTDRNPRAYDSGWSRAGGFVESILAGLLIGFLLDKWLGTEPWLILTGFLLGCYAGFMKIWAMLKEQDRQTDAA